MIPPEDSLDEIRDYLKGRLSEEEAAAFRRRMADDPALEDQVAFARLMVGGLEELNKQKKSSHPKRNLWLIFLLVLVLIVAGWLFFKQRETPPPQDPVEPKIVGSLPSDNTADLAVNQGGGNSEEKNSDRAASITWTSTGEVILGGQFLNGARFGDFNLPGFGKEDIFIAACNQQSEFLWAMGFGSPEGQDECEKIAVDSKDNILVTGRMFNNAIFGNEKITATGIDDGGPADFFTAKMDPAGNPVWIDHAGGIKVPHKQTGTNRGNCITSDLHDNVIVAGGYIGSAILGGITLPAGGPNEDLFLAKYSPQGQILWAKAVTGTYMLYPNTVDTDPQGNIYLTGFFGHHNLGGSATFDGITLESYGGGDIFIAKYAENGSLIWVKQAGSSDLNNRDIGNTIDVDAHGSCVIAGFFSGKARFGDFIIQAKGARDIFLAKYDTCGKILWTQSFGGTKQDGAHGVRFDKNGNIFLSGNFTGSANFGNHTLTSLGKDDIFVAKCDPNGRLLWVRQMGGDGKEFNSDSSSDIAIDHHDNLVVTGFFSGTMRIGNQTLTSKGREDIFILFFDKNGNVLEAKQVNYEL